MRALKIRALLQVIATTALWMPIAEALADSNDDGVSLFSLECPYVLTMINDNTYTGVYQLTIDLKKKKYLRRLISTTAPSGIEEPYVSNVFPISEINDNDIIFQRQDNNVGRGFSKISRLTGEYYEEFSGIGRNGYFFVHSHKGTCEKIPLVPFPKKIF